MENYITTKEFAEKYGLDQVTVKKRCSRGAIPGAIKIGTPPHQLWLIPADAENKDGRIKSGKYINAKRSKPKIDNQSKDNQNQE